MSALSITTLGFLGGGTGSPYPVTQIEASTPSNQVVFVVAGNPVTGVADNGAGAVSANRKVLFEVKNDYN